MDASRLESFLEIKRIAIRGIIKKELKANFLKENHPNNLSKYCQSRKYLEDIEQKWEVAPYNKYKHISIAMLDVELMKEYEIWLKQTTKREHDTELCEVIYEKYEECLEQNEDAIMEKIDESIRLSRKIIDIYEAMMFFRKHVRHNTLTHYFIDFKECLYDFSGELVEDGEIDLSIRYPEFLGEYTGDKEASFCSGRGWTYITYLDIIHEYGSNLAMRIQNETIISMMKETLGINEDFDFDSIDYELRETTEGKTIAWEFFLHPNYFGTYDDCSLGEYLEIGEKYSKLYDEYCKNNNVKIDEYLFLKTLEELN